MLIDINDPGSIKLGSNLDTDFDESQWTHFSRIAPLDHKEADALRAAIEAVNKEGK